MSEAGLKREMLKGCGGRETSVSSTVTAPVSCGKLLKQPLQNHMKINTQSTTEKSKQNVKNVQEPTDRQEEGDRNEQQNREQKLKQKAKV